MDNYYAEVCRGNQVASGVEQWGLGNMELEGDIYTSPRMCENEDSLGRGHALTYGVSMAFRAVELVD